MKKIYVILVIALLFAGCTIDKEPHIKSAMFQSVSAQEATLTQSGKDKESCVRCGMNLIRYYKTSHAAEDEKRHYQYCSIHCLEDHLGEGVTLKNPKVVDVDSLKFIPVSDAYYVVGSNIRGTMTRVSKYAFLNRSMAKEFQDKYGGEIMSFKGALEVTKKDFKR
ncbi:MAG: nitrous oxide reductase accessory protein NosL [Sulfurimonas sp.]|uniref:nitrous oxide reductase accessory protein NosL n=1 Tax=Sulfurimonas sp. TaxID=2022749 RepID=UPI0025D792A4|nr:nitrous oxide reductase accessory protein NosL [Sulfurimonas sp.]MCK9492506.1 nitrous oxide reductase accessory protein NosL [Sulfurimonas sp.]